MDEESIVKPSTDLFDRRFVFAACFIGIAYALFLTAFAKVTSSKEGAGVAGIALSAVATGIFKKFETLRFRELAKDEGVIIPVTRFHFLPLASASLFSLFIYVLAPAVFLIPIMLYKLSFYTLSDEKMVFESAMRIGIETGNYLSHSALVNGGVAILTLALFCLFGMACASIAEKRTAYYYAVFSSLIGQSLVPAIAVLMFLLSKLRGNVSPFSVSTETGVWALANIAAALAGAVLWSKRKERRKGALEV